MGVWRTGFRFDGGFQPTGLVKVDQPNLPSICVPQMVITIMSMLQLGEPALTWPGGQKTGRSGENQ